MVHVHPYAPLLAELSTFTIFDWVTENAFFVSFTNFTHPVSFGGGAWEEGCCGRDPTPQSGGNQHSKACCHGEEGGAWTRGVYVCSCVMCVINYVHVLECMKTTE